MILEKLNRAEAFRYMGHKGGEIPANIEALADECEQQLLKNIAPKFTWRVFDIENKPEGVEIKGTPLVFKGSGVAAHLRTCEKCALLCATLGGGADSVIRSYEACAMEKAVVADCLASAAIEQVCDLAEREIREKLPGMYFTWRFSPGYGDFPLDVQADFIKTMDAQRRIGLSVSESLILIPRKSVTAVIGISERELPKVRRGCVSCNMRDRCEFRKSGKHC